MNILKAKKLYWEMVRYHAEAEKVLLKILASPLTTANQVMHAQQLYVKAAAQMRSAQRLADKYF